MTPIKIRPFSTTFWAPRGVSLQVVDFTLFSAFSHHERVFNSCLRSYAQANGVDYGYYYVHARSLLYVHYHIIYVHASSCLTLVLYLHTVCNIHTL